MPLRRYGQCKDYAPPQARRKGGAANSWRSLAPAISREDHSSYCSAQSIIVTLVLENSLEIWSKTAKTPGGAETELAFQLSFDEVLRSTRTKCNESELAQRKPPGTRSCFAEYRLL